MTRLLHRAAFALVLAEVGLVLHGCNRMLSMVTK